MIDAVVQQKIREAGKMDDEIFLAQADLVSAKPRVLDKPPELYKMRKAQFDAVYGCFQEFVLTYNSIKQQLNLDHPGTLATTQYEVTCDPEVFYVLKTLVLTGFSHSAEQSQVCAKLFYVIAAIKEPHITAQHVYAQLQNIRAKSYYAKQILNAIDVCLFNRNATYYKWLSLVEPQGFYQKAILRGREFIEQEGFTETQLTKFLREKYALAKEDKSFMKSLYKPACNKWLAAMIYHLKNKYPEVLDYSSNTDGFMEN